MDEACRTILSSSQQLHEPLYTAIAYTRVEHRDPSHSVYTESQASAKLNPGPTDAQRSHTRGIWYQTSGRDNLYHRGFDPSLNFGKRVFRNRKSIDPAVLSRKCIMEGLLAWETI